MHLRFCLTTEPFGSRRETCDRELRRREEVHVDLPNPRRFSGRRNGSVSSSKVIAILAVFVLLALIVVIGAVVVALYYSNSQTAANNIYAQPKSSVAPTPAIDAEKERLKNELANLQKKLDEKASSVGNSRPFPSEKDERHSMM